MWFFRSTLLFLYAVLTINQIYSLVGAKTITPCETKNPCQAIHPNDYGKGIFSSCLKCKKGESKTFCGTVYVNNPDINHNATAVNPQVSGKSVCDARPKKDATCLMYAQANSPYKGKEGGKMYANCYVAATGYLCSAPPDAEEQYLTCSIQAIKCPSL